MMDFETGFYKNLFESLDNNSVLMRVEQNGEYYPIWCSKEFTEMMEGTEEDFIRLENGGTMSTIHPEDREEVAYLFRNHVTKDGTNSLTIRKYTVKGNEIWVNIHYAFVEDHGVQYAYCTYTNVTDIKKNEIQLEKMYEGTRQDLIKFSQDTLATVRVNLDDDVIEASLGQDLYETDAVTRSFSEGIKARAAYLPIQRDRERFLEMFSVDNLMRVYREGGNLVSDVMFSRRENGRQCFVNYTATLMRQPVTGHAIAFITEREYNSEKVNEVLFQKVLAQQYDMVSYVVSGNYGVVIGDPASIKKGSIFPKEMNGSYMGYIREQVVPVASEKEHNRDELLQALSPETIDQKLAESEPYTVDVACEIGGELFYKRFMFFLVDRQAKFYILLKSDITDVVKEQQERNEQEQKQAAYASMLDQFNALADESLTVIRSNMTTGVIEEVRGVDLYPTDYAGCSVADYAEARLESFLVESDRKKYEAVYTLENLLERTAGGQGPATLVGYCKRASGRRCFVRFSGSASRNPVTGDVVAFGVETEYNTEMVNTVLNEKVLAQQYDMVTYIVSGYYGVAIGDAANITRGSIFPKERDGVYMDYIREQVIPVASEEEHNKEDLLKALSMETVSAELETGDSYSVDVACLIDGEIFNKQFTFYAVDREKDFYILLKSDVTDVLQKQREQNELLANALREAEQANAAKTAFLSSMSHEIRTPMNAIIGLDSIALSDPDLPEKTREQLEKIGGSAKHLLSLINDILDMSRIESGRMMLKNEEFSFREMLEQINTMINGQCQDKGLTYDCHINGKVNDYYIGDDMKLKQVIINILGNAVKFTPEGGTVTFVVEPVSQFEDKATLRFMMKDTGIGMDKSYLPKIFDAFSQEDANKANKYGSTGLGMAITKNIVEMMNGNIAVESEKGVGSTFTVTVTLKQSDKKEDNASDVRPQDLRVLVIDDDPVACEHAKLVLEEVGIVSDSCFSGKEALEMLRLAHARREAYNLILVDLKMPEQNGVEVTREIRELYHGESTIIILTAYSWDDIMEEALAAGVDSFMAKPLFASGILQEFKQVIARKNAAHEEVRKADLTGKRILLAEDMLINAEIMKELLGMREMEVDHAENGQIVVEMFAQSRERYYDAILMDVRMPVMTGLEATEAIRALDRPDAKTVPIIAMTANAFDEDVQRSLQVGMNAHLSKPVEPEHLYETLEILIQEIE